MLIYIISYLAAFLTARIQLYAVSGILLIAAALYLFNSERIKSGNIINLRGLFSLSFVGGQGLSCLKLSYLQKDWQLLTWLCFFLAFTCFYLSFDFAKAHSDTAEEDKKNKDAEALKSENMNIILYAISVISLTSLIAFVIEVSMLRFIPLFTRGVPHAYSYFHISGLHYFTVMCVLVPALSVIYVNYRLHIELVDKLVLGVSNFIALSIPLLCVSRFQFIFAIMLAGICFLRIRRDISVKKLILPAICIIIPVYIVLTVARSHNISYLNSIFEMKWKLPIFISQPYIYIANNYDNFNELITRLPAHSFGLKLLFPFFALTGLKFKFPELVNFPLYTTKTELSTLTLFYDAYYDFGIAGIIGFAVILGFIACKLERLADNNPISFLFYSQFAVYFLFAFFTTWFSNPATWFYLGVTVVLYVAYYCYGIKIIKKTV